jgi:hypothetical protein
MWTRAARCALSVSRKRQVLSRIIATKLLFIFLNNLKRSRKQLLRSVQWKFAPRSQSETKGEVCEADESPLQELP